MLEYLHSKAVTLCFLLISALSFITFMIVADVKAGYIFIAVFLFIFIVLGWFLTSYFFDRRRFEKLSCLERSLEDKYLLGELLPVPSNILERQYYDVMRTISCSAISLAETSMRDKEEYCQYIENWIHELKTPLTACSLILANDASVSKLRRELKRADNLTENILYYARLRTVEKDTQIKQTQAAAIMEDAVKSQMELLIAAGISVETKGDMNVYTDGKQLCFILKQFLINCAKYCPNCHVVLTAGNGKITVEDNGVGIPSHEISRVTQRGFTGENGRRIGNCTGMGLFIADQLCKNLGISLSINSVQGKFTKITLIFDNLTKT